MLIGITGGVGTGKSTIMNVLASSYKAKLIIADNVAKSLMKPGNECYDQIIKEFGEGVLFEVPSGQLYGASAKPIKPLIDTKKLSDIVFDDPEKLKKLENIIHPAVREEIIYTLDELYKAKPNMLVVLEAALLIEGGYKEICDDLWVVTADRETRINRLMNSRKYTRERCEQIMNEQLPDDEFIKHADFVLDNSGDIEDTVKQIRARLKELGDF